MFKTKDSSAMEIFEKKFKDGLLKVSISESSEPLYM
jgi:hypothetical protein